MNTVRRKQGAAPRRAALTLALAGALAAGPAQAWHLGWFLELAIEHNDNVLLSETDQVSDTIVTPALGFDLRNDGSTVQARVAGVVEHRNYLDNAYGSELLAEVDGMLNWVAVPGRLHFVVQDRLSVQPVSLAAPDSPANRQLTNVFAAGPTVFFRLGPTVNGQAELRWIDTWAEDSAGFDSQRLSLALRAAKQLGPGSTLSANLQAQRVDIEDALLAPDYDRYDAFVRWRRNLRTFDLEFDAGYSWLEFEHGGSRSSPLLRAMAAWRASERSSLSATAMRRFSDTAEYLIEPVAIDGTVPAPTLPPGAISGDATINALPYEETSVELTWAYDGARATFAAGPFHRRLDYVADEGPDQTGRGVQLGFGWRFSSTLRLEAAARAETLRFRNTGLENDTRYMAVFLHKGFTPHWSSRFGYTRYERDSSESGLSADQNVWYLAVTYTR